jgi:hypothetical protein
VAVESGVAVAVIDEDHVAVPAVGPSGKTHGAGTGGEDRLVTDCEVVTIVAVVVDELTQLRGPVGRKYVRLLSIGCVRHESVTNHDLSVYFVVRFVVVEK